MPKNVFMRVAFSIYFEYVYIKFLDSQFWMTFLKGGCHLYVVA